MDLTGIDLLVTGGMQAGGSACQQRFQVATTCSLLLCVCWGSELLLRAYSQALGPLSHFSSPPVSSRVSVPSDVPCQQLLTCTPANTWYHKALGFPGSWVGAGAAVSLGTSPWFLAAYIPPF